MTSPRPARAQPEGLRLRAMAPGLTVNDLDRSIRFYCDGLGFFLTDRWEQDGKLLGVMLKAGTIEIGLSQDDFAKGRDRVKGVGMRFWVTTVQDLDMLAGRVRAAGYSVDSEPALLPWGQRAFDLTDPDGFKFTIANPAVET